MRKALIISTLATLCLTCFASAPQDLDKIRLEQAFWDGLMTFVPKGLNLPQGELKRIEKNLYVSENGWYETEAVQNTAFYRRSLLGFQPVCEAARPVESVMTFLTGHTGKTNFTVNLLQHRYSFGTAETSLPLAFLLEYCFSTGCTPYVGIESHAHDTIVAVLFMVNQDAGYCHTFKFEIDKALLDTETGSMSAEAYTFTPIHNLKQ